MKMVKTLLTVLSLAVIAVPAHAAENTSGWDVVFYEHPNKGGKHLNITVRNEAATMAQAIDRFDQAGLQDKISEIRYKLPVNSAVVCFTGRFFKNADGDLRIFWNDHKDEIKAVTKAKTGVVLPFGTFGKSPLILKGTGKEEVVKLWEKEVAGGKYDNKIRSARLTTN